MKKIKLAICLMMTLLLVNGCDDKEVSSITTKGNITQNNKDESNKITSNKISHTEDELINIINKTSKEEIYMTKEQRYDLRADIYDKMSEDGIGEFTGKIDICYSMLTDVITDDRYKELLDKENSRWNLYEENNLFGVAITMDQLYYLTDNEELKNDLKRISDLCEYGVSNRDVVAIIDARRIISDIRTHVLNVDYFKENDEKVQINEDEHEIYYKSSELIEKDNYKTIGQYK